MEFNNFFDLNDYVNNGIPVTLIKIIDWCRHNESTKEAVGLMRIINDNELDVVEEHYKKYLIFKKQFIDLASSTEGIKAYQRYYGMQLERATSDDE